LPRDVEHCPYAQSDEADSAHDQRRGSDVRRWGNEGRLRNASACPSSAVRCESECIADLQCLDVSPEEGSPNASGSRICTVPCSADADCDQDPWTDHTGYCDSSFCRRGRPAGASCSRNAHCASRLCNVANGTCG
jgi:hypothetical protein